MRSAASRAVGSGSGRLVSCAAAGSLTSRCSAGSRRPFPTPRSGAPGSRSGPPATSGTQRPMCRRSIRRSGTRTRCRRATLRRLGGRHSARRVSGRSLRLVHGRSRCADSSGGASRAIGEHLLRFPVATSDPGGPAMAEMRRSASPGSPRYRCRTAGPGADPSSRSRTRPGPVRDGPTRRCRRKRG
jgi:hypothetical protein